MKNQNIKYWIGTLLFALCFGLLYRHSTNNSSLNALNFLLIMLLAWSFYSYAVFSKINFSIKQLIIAALSFRLIAILTDPLMEDDYFRYLWNGFQFVEFGQLRTLPPMDFFSHEVPENMSLILSGVNNPHLPSIYSPLTEYIFALSYLIAPGKLFVIKLIYLLIEVLTILGVYKLFSSKELLLILWNPLIIFETYVNAHPDITAMCFLILAWSAFKQQNFLLLGVFIGLGFSSRFFLLLCLPLVLVSLRSLSGFLLSTSIVYTPFLVLEKSFGSLGTFINEWEFNSFVFGILRSITTYSTAKWICALLLLIFTLLFWLKFFSQRAKMQGEDSNALNLDILFLGLFLLSAVFNPWYCIAFIPFIIINQRNFLLFIPLALSLSYIHGLNMPSAAMKAYEIPIGIQLAEYIIITLCLLVTFKDKITFLRKISLNKLNTHVDKSFKNIPQKENQ